jgi:carbonic anhydrase
MHAQNKDSQSKMSAKDALDTLMAGNARFLDDSRNNHQLLKQVKETGAGQYPFAAVLSCIDSRVPVEVVFDQGIGDIFSARVAGNFINTDILGSLEYSCKVAGSKLVMVLGHTSCGAVKGACDHVELGNITSMLSKIMPAVDNVKTADGEKRDSSNASFVNNVVVENVRLAIKNIHAHSPVLTEMEENGEIEIVGAVYDVKNGKVELL